MAKVVVTGARGFVGGHLVETLAERGDEVIAFDCGTPTDDGRDGTAKADRYVQGNICDPAQLAEAITDGVEIVYHLAALVGVDHYIHRPIDVIDVNVFGTRNVLDLAVRTGAKVVVASTSEVFGKNPAVPWTENADRVLGPTATDRWSYSSSKAVAEHLTFAFIRQRELRASIVRYFNLYGPRQRPAFVLSRSIHRALRGLAPVVYDDGRQTRSFTYVGDVIDATVQAGMNPKSDGESFNIGSAEETSIQQAVEFINELTGAEPEVVPLDTGRKFGESYQDLPRRIPDTSKANSVLGWHHRTKLREGLQQTIDWARANPWWLEQSDSGAG
jgi:UDP-glucose 4-epimerase